MILSSGETAGSVARSLSVLPSAASIGAICGRATKPPNGIVPRLYCTPLMVFAHSGLPNQMPNFSMTSPRQRAARKWPSLVDDDEQVEDQDDFEDQEDEVQNGADDFHGGRERKREAREFGRRPVAEGARG